MNVIRIPLPPALESSFAAYVKVSGAPDNLKKVGIEWVSRLCEDPIRADLVRLIESELVHVRSISKSDVPEPPLNILQTVQTGPEEERRYNEATHVVVVRAQFPLRHPPMHVFGALAAAKGIAAAFDGVVFDPPPGMPRLLSVQSLEEPIPSDGRLNIAKYIVCPVSRSDEGAWMTTVGMKRFGLPNFEMRFLPPNLREVLPVMNAIAHRVLHEALRQAWQAGETPINEIAIPSEFTITQQDMVAAFGKGEASAGQAVVRLSFDGQGRDGMEPFIAIGPPASYKGEVGEWYHSMLSEFFGGAQQPSPVTRTAGDAALERACARAVSEWPGVKERFVRGLPHAQQLFVKRGFPIEGQGLEFMWIAVVGLRNGEVAGTLANDSAYEHDLRAGAQVRFAETDIFDWMLVDGERREGGYSIEALDE